MPRDSNGNMALPAGNPVVSDTPISSTVHNNTMNDLANEIQDSLSRSGKGGMLAPFKHVDGTVGSPGITFDDETTSGLYRAGTGDVRLSLLGSLLMQLSSTLIKLVSHVTDGASAVGVEIDTANALANAGAKLLRVLNATVEKFYIDKDGQVGPHVYSVSGLISTLAAVGATLKGNVANGATAVGIVLDNVNALANAASKALSVRVAGVEKAYVSNVGKGFFVGLDAGGGTISSLVGLALGGGALTGVAAPSPIAITPNANWTSGSGLSYWKDSFGIVRLKGSCLANSGAGNPVFTLPVGYRPLYDRYFAIMTASLSGRYLYVNSDGRISMDPTNGVMTFVDAVSFLAEQ